MLVLASRVRTGTLCLSCDDSDDRASAFVALAGANSTTKKCDRHEVIFERSMWHCSQILPFAQRTKSSSLFVQFVPVCGVLLLKVTGFLETSFSPGIKPSKLEIENLVRLSSSIFRSFTLQAKLVRQVSYSSHGTREWVSNWLLTQCATEMHGFILSS